MRDSTFLDGLGETAPPVALLVIQPESQHGWVRKSIHQLRRARCPRRVPRSCAAHHGGDAGLAPHTTLSERTQGIPSSGESVRTLVGNAGLVGDRGAYRLRQGADEHPGASHGPGGLAGRAATGSAGGETTLTKLPPSSAPRCPSRSPGHCRRPRAAPPGPQPSAGPSSSTRRASSPSTRITSSSPHPQVAYETLCRSGGARCMPALSRP